MTAVSHPRRPSLQEAYQSRQRETRPPRTIADAERPRRAAPRRQALSASLLEALRSGTRAARIARALARALAVVLMILLAVLVGGWVADRYAG